jgi:hypothetical protein
VIQPSLAARTASPGLAPVDTTNTTDPKAPIPPAVDPGGSGSGGAAVTFPDGEPFTAPTVPVGNGRTPGILTWRHGADGAPQQTGAGPADVVRATVKPVVEAPSPPSPPAPPLPQTLPPTSRLDVAPPWQRTVSSMWAAAAAPSAPGGLAFGIAGLILAPLAGVWLGYRQARASRAAAQLVDR